MKKGSQLNKESLVSNEQGVPAQEGVRVSGEEEVPAKQGVRGLK